MLELESVPGASNSYPSAASLIERVEALQFGGVMRGLFGDFKELFNDWEERKMVKFNSMGDKVSEIQKVYFLSERNPSLSSQSLNNSLKSPI